VSGDIKADRFHNFIVDFNVLWKKRWNHRNYDSIDHSNLFVFAVLLNAGGSTLDDLSYYSQVPVVLISLAQLPNRVVLPFH